MKKVWLVLLFLMLLIFMIATLENNTQLGHCIIVCVCACLITKMLN